MYDLQEQEDIKKYTDKYCKYINPFIYDEEFKSLVSVHLNGTKDSKIEYLKDKVASEVNVATVIAQASPDFFKRYKSAFDVLFKADYFYFNYPNGLKIENRQLYKDAIEEDKRKNGLSAKECFDRVEELWRNDNKDFKKLLNTHNIRDVDLFIVILFIAVNEFIEEFKLSIEDIDKYTDFLSLIKTCFGVCKGNSKMYKDDKYIAGNRLVEKGEENTEIAYGPQRKQALDIYNNNLNATQKELKNQLLLKVNMSDRTLQQWAKDLFEEGRLLSDKERKIKRKKKSFKKRIGA